MEIHANQPKSVEASAAMHFSARWVQLRLWGTFAKMNNHGNLWESNPASIASIAPSETQPQPQPLRLAGSCNTAAHAPPTPPANTLAQATAFAEGGAEGPRRITFDIANVDHFNSALARRD